jgi:hypothetical protein
MVQCTTAVRLQENGALNRKKSKCYLFNSCLRKQDKRHSPIYLKF